MSTHLIGLRVHPSRRQSTSFVSWYGRLSIRYIPPSSLRNKKQLNDTSLRLSWSVWCVLFWHHSLQCLPYFCFSHVLHKTSSHVAWTSVFQGPFSVLASLHTDADQALACLTSITEDSVASSLSTAVCPPSFSVCTVAGACSCSIIVSIESFQLHLVACLHQHSEQKQDAAYLWALSDPVAFVGPLHPLGDLDPVHHRVQQGVHRQCVLVGIVTVHFVSCNASFDAYTTVATSSPSSGHVRTDCARGNQSESPSGTSSVRCLHMYRVPVCILCPSCPADVGLRTIQLVRRLCQMTSASSNCGDSLWHSMGSGSRSTFCIFG